MSARPADTGGPPHLAGLRVLVPRGGEWGAGVADGIRERGGVPVIAPLIRIAPPADPRALAAAIERWNAGAFDWLVVTSANTAAVLTGARRPAGSRVAAVGPATARALRGIGLDADLQPPADFSAAGLARALVDAAGRDPVRLLLPVSEIAGDALEGALHGAGHTVERVTAYRTIPEPPDPGFDGRVGAGAEVDAILVTSASVAAAVARRFPGLPGTVRLAAIGGPSADALAAAGRPAHVVAGTHTVEGLLDALAASFARDSSPTPPERDPLPTPTDSTPTERSGA